MVCSPPARRPPLRRRPVPARDGGVCVAERRAKARRGRVVSGLAWLASLKQLQCRRPGCAGDDAPHFICDASCQRRLTAAFVGAGQFIATVCACHGHVCNRAHEWRNRIATVRRHAVQNSSSTLIQFLENPVKTTVLKSRCMRTLTMLLATGAALVVLTHATPARADAASGKNEFGICAGCHSITDTDGVGPHLNGVLGRKSGS